MIKKLTLTLFILCLSITQISHAAAPIPERKTNSLEALEEKLKNEKLEKKELESELSKLQGNLKSTKEQLIKKAEQVQTNEYELKKIEDRITELEKEQGTLDYKIAEDKKSIGKLILALERIRRIPPEAIIASPEAPIKTARSSYLISKIVPPLNEHAKQMSERISKLEDNKKELEDKRKKAYERTENLKRQYKKLSGLIEKRESIYKSIQGDYDQHKKKIDRIAKEANNLKDLMSELDKEEARKDTRQMTYNAVKRMEVLNQPVTRSKTGNQLPVSGILRVRYGDPDKFGAESKGLKIEARSNALVVAPMAGKIKYSGEFKSYGNILIIEHEKGYHSLVAGLEKIDTVVGQAVAAGEPIGSLPQSYNGKKPTLYYELRYKGNAVNPAKKFADLT